MFEEDEEELNPDAPPQSPVWRVAKKLLKFLAMAIIIGVNVLLLCRMFMSGDPASMKALSINDKLVEAYRANGELRAVAQVEQVITHDKSEEHYNYGYFSITNSVFLPTAKQVQVVFRYNDSTLRHLAEDYKLEKTPDKKQDWYDITLRLVLDRTPDNKKDNGETYWEDLDAVKIVRIQPSEVKSTTKPLYSYRRLTFDGVPSIEDNSEVLAVYIDVYYKGDVDYNLTPYGSMRIYTGGVTIHDYDLSGRDIRAIKKQLEK